MHAFRSRILPRPGGAYASWCQVPCLEDAPHGTAPGLLPDCAVYALSDDVCVTVMPRGLLNHVQQYGSEVDLGTPRGADHAIKLRAGNDLTRPVAYRHVPTHKNLDGLLWTHPEVRV